MKFINEFVEKDIISGQFLVGQVSKGTSLTSGQNYLTIELKDSSGQINCKKWTILPGDETTFVNGNIVEVEMEISKYREQLQGTIEKGTLVNEEDIQVAKFVKMPPIKREVLEEKQKKLLNSIVDPTCKAFIDFFMKKFGEQIFYYPAASSIHHEYQSGLLMHSTSMMELADYIGGFYPDINKDLLITGCFLHDLGKIIELEGTISYKYSLEGKLVGHISIMAGEIRCAAKELGLENETVILLEHMVLSHHGQLEFGSPVLPLTKEALLLSLIDNLDSKMTIVGKALDEIDPGEFTQKIYPLDSRMFYKPKK